MSACSAFCAWCRASDSCRAIPLPRLCGRRDSVAARPAHAQARASPGGCCRRLRSAGTERVLEVGSGSGFLTACLAAASREVHSVELIADIARACARKPCRAQSRQRTGRQRRCARSLLRAQRYEAIALSASLPLYDERWQRQLAIGGRLFVVVGEPPVMEARLVRRLAEQSWSSVSLFETVIDPLRNAQHREQFRF